MTSRERISKYVQEKQMFWITDSANKQGVMLREDPEAADETNFFESSSKGRYVHVKWFCTPKHAPDSNGDGMYDNLVAHSVSFMSADYNEETKTATARKWNPQGYTASWFEGGGYYNEVQVDFDGATVFHFNGPRKVRVNSCFDMHSCVQCDFLMISVLYLAFMYLPLIVFASRMH